MIDHGPGTTAVVADAASQPRPHRRNRVVSGLTCYLVLLLAIPSSLVVGPLGAAGAPADVFAVFLFCWYLLARLHPATPVDTGRQPVRVAAALFACATMASYVSANRTTLTGLMQNGSDRGLILLAGWMGVVLLTADGIDRADQLATVLRRVVIGVTAMSVMAIVEFITGQDFSKYIVIPGLSVHEPVTDLINRNGLFRAMATAGQPLELTAVLLMCLPIAIHKARFASGSSRLRRWLPVALIGGALPTTVSRTSILGLAVIIIALFPTWSRRDRRRGYGVLLAAIALCGVADPKILAGFGSLIANAGTDTSISSRTSAYSAALPYIAQHLWLGFGFQTFYPQNYFFIDNQYLTSLIETGVVGLLALITLFATGWFTARSARWIAPSEESRDLLQSLAASVAAAAASFSTFDVLSFVIAPGLAFLLIGCAGAAWRLARAGQLHPAGQPPAVPGPR
jgi:polysaccharide biosynthesis protein PslJ